jgi:elongation factor G
MFLLRGIWSRGFSSKIRNIGIIAHIDAGKTTTSERIIHKSGLIRRAGSVDSGDTVMDYLPEEKERGITIASAAITLPWRGFKLNLIDTPGHVDFTVEVERALRVMDGSVVILDASKGIQAQTLTVWRQAQRHGLKSIVYINKMDKVGANVAKCLSDVREKLGLEPILVNVCIFSGKEGCEFMGVKCVLDSRELQEQVAQFDEEFLEKYLFAAESVTSGDVKQALACITENGSGAVVTLVGSSSKDLGIDAVLDGIVDYLPGPKEGMAGDEEEFKALAFKVVFDAKRKGFLVYCRVYSGRLDASKRPVLFNVNKGQKEQLGSVMQVMADEMVEVEEASQGQIVIFTGLKHTATGDTLSTKKGVGCLSGINAPTPVISVAIEAESRGAQDHLEECLEVLQLEDPSARVTLDKQTGQTILSGMGELHIEILKGRLSRDLKAKFSMGPIKISLQEALQFRDGEILQLDHLLDREIHGIKLKGSVKLALEESDSFEIQFMNCPESVKETVSDAINGALGRGPLAGHGVQRNVRVIVSDLQFLADNSAHVVVYEGLESLLKNAAEEGKMILQEPLMRIELESPDVFIGDITSDLYSSRGCTECGKVDGGLWAKVPLSRVLGYSQWLRTKTGGMASFTIESAGWTPVIAKAELPGT